MSNHFFPNTTQTPDVILDRWLAVLNGSEFKVLMYLVRRTYGFGKRDGDAISLKQMVSGIRRTTDGTPLDWGVGLDKDTVLGALSVLVGLGMVVRTQQRGEKQEYTPTHYAINLSAPMLDRDEAIKAIRDLRATFKKNPSREIPTTPLAEESDRGLGGNFGQPLSEKSDSPLAEESDRGCRKTSAIQHTEHNIQKDKQHQQTDSVADHGPVAVGDDDALPEDSVISETAEMPAETLESNPLQDSLASQLIALGVTDVVAFDLAANFPERCQKQLEYLPHRNVRNPGGFLNRAVRENFPPPTGYGAAKASAAPARAPKPKMQDSPERQLAKAELEKLLARVEADPDLWAEVQQEAHKRLPTPVRDSKIRGSAYQGALRGKIIEVVLGRRERGEI
jgi:hypothetical protein